MSTYKQIKTLEYIHHDLKVIAAYESRTLQDLVIELFEKFIEIKKRQHSDLKLISKPTSDKSLYRPELDKYRDEKTVSKFENGR